MKSPRIGLRVVHTAILLPVLPLLGCQVFEGPRTEYPAAVIAARDYAIHFQEPGLLDPMRNHNKLKGVCMSNIHLVQLTIRNRRRKFVAS